MQVLVVDNDNDSVQMYKILLNHFEAIVTLSRSVNDALNILGWLRPNIIVCEIRFLGESAYRLLKKLHAIEAGNGNHTPINVTSTCGIGFHEQIPGIFDGYLLKPFDPGQLVLTIANFLMYRRNNSLASV